MRTLELSVQNGIAQALKEMGFGTGKDAIARWRQSEYEVLKGICTMYGIELLPPEKSVGSKSVELYKEEKRLEEKVQKLREMELAVAIVIKTLASLTAALSQALKYGYFYPVDPYAVVWYTKYEGVITEDMLHEMDEDKTKLEVTIERPQKLLDDMDERGNHNSPTYSSVEQHLREAEDQYNALLPIIENVRDGVDYTSRTERNIILIKPYSYDMLIKRDMKTVRRNSVFILIGIIAAISGVYSFERQNHMDIMLRSTYRGRLAVNVVKPIWGLPSIVRIKDNPDFS